MAANENPIYTKAPVIGNAQVSTANTKLDGTGTLVDVVTGITEGTRISRITIQATVTTTVGWVNLFIYDGTNTRLWRQIPVSAITVSATVAGFHYDLELFGERALELPSTYVLRASTYNAEAINVIAEGGNNA